MHKVFINPGHGGRDPGALGNGMRESDIVLSVALHLEAVLQANGVESILSRRTDVAAAQTWQLANAENCHCFIDIHTNAFHLDSANGYETFYPANKPQDRVFARYVHDGYLSAINIRDRGVKPDGQTQHSGGIGRLRNARMPACLVELAFITANPRHFTDVSILRTQAQPMAHALARGILAFLRQGSAPPENEKGGEDMRYQSVEDMPSWAQPYVKSLIESGDLQGNAGGGAGLDLSHDMLRLIVLNERRLAGVCR